MKSEDKNDLICFESVHLDRTASQSTSSGLWVVPCQDIGEKQFVVCLRSVDIKSISDINPGFRYSEALKANYRYLSPGKAFEELVVSFELPESGCVSVSLERWKMNKDTPISEFIDSVYLVKRYGQYRILEKA